MRYTVILTPSSDINNVSTVCGEAEFLQLSEQPKVDQYIFESGSMVNWKGDWLDTDVEVAKIEVQAEDDRERRLFQYGKTFVTYNEEENKFTIKYIYP
ncbi:hypothetical protein PPL_08385 [Heterostelium album PN500]|uniref:Uncharacterized protein n=1 Tax=Heterostelium pallidum (strain ATCC 26659 / Pp 5 / PN500) TaxID=670386 RepID=D3BI17_HETP5|nr:hypothetical protein PPL_08385 [Heterostelium album PN500]EFA78917.1 hypothetical protein PPL_08385 [Heterostelium album PN500]|eukprot:XP_020431041.1 hypothetical protein PPL_08385 [Heterostelium album PN500]